MGYIEDENILVLDLENGNQEVFNGDYEEFLEMNNYDSELELLLNKLLTREQKYVIFINEDGNKLLIKRDY